MSEVGVDLLEWQRVGPEQHPDLAGFRFATEDDRRQAGELSASRIIEFQELHDGLRIAARSYVGRIRFENLTVTVRPKLAAPELLALFRYAYGLRSIRRFRGVAYSTAGSLFQDLVIAQLHAEVRSLLDRSLARSYVRRDTDLASPRGRITFARLAARGGVTSGTLPCESFSRSSDHLLNRVVLAGLRLARSTAQDRELKTGLAMQERAMADLASGVELSGHLLRLAQRRINRLVAPYASVVRLIEILYYGRFVQLEESGQAQTLPGFLFDMNRFFQALMQRFLTDNLPHYQVEPERGLKDMMRYVPSQNPGGRQAPRPRPDYAIKRDNKVLSLLDAKYRDLWVKALPREMLYQLSVYALSQPKGSTAAILYPTDAPTACGSLIEIREPLSGGTAGYVALRPVHLHRLVALIEDEGPGRDQAREKYALGLVGLS